ncbi:MAG TPA: tol-pal system protein YbgF [Longimicrobiales bacterium]|nr:tol-pal system protein YbgF [Longimicrobiales bacterium]
MVAVMMIMNRRGLLLAPIACMAMLAGGCATKSDIRDLSMEMGSMRAQQDSLYREIQRQNLLLADSVRGGAELIRSTRGQLSNQIKQLNDVVISLQQLLGQTQQRITELRERAEQAQAPPVQPTQPAGGNAQDADELYRTGATKLQEKSATAARMAFEQFLTQFPQHERAPDAQFGLAETFALEGERADAVTQFVKVAEAYPTSPRAPEALYRAGQISEERERRSEARTYYQRVVQRYGSSPSARLAQQRLNRLR